MVKISIAALLAISVLLAGCAAPAPPGPPVDVRGIWDGVANPRTGHGAVITMTLTQDDVRVAGELDYNGNPVSMSGSVRGNAVTLSGDFLGSDAYINFQGTVAGNVMEGSATLVFPGRSVFPLGFSVSRRPQASTAVGSHLHTGRSSSSQASPR